MEVVSDCSDALRMVEAFRTRGVRGSAMHSLMPSLLAARSASGFDGFVEIREESEAEAAIFTICCNEFLLDVQIHAAPELCEAIAGVSLSHTAQEAAPWAHASISQLEVELLAALRAGEADRFFSQLQALREAQLIAIRAPLGAEWYEARWTDAAAQIEVAAGAPPVRCCEGLRLEYFSPAGREGSEAYAAVVCLAEGNPPAFQLKLSPPLLLQRSDATGLGAKLSGGEGWLKMLLGKEPAAHGPLGSGSLECSVPLHGRTHVQQWEVSADGHLEGASLASLPLEASELSGRLGSLLSALRLHAAFTHVARSCISDSLLANCVPTGPKIRYRLELQAQPPSALAVICHLPLADGVPRLAELTCQVDTSVENREAPIWRVHLRDILFNDETLHDDKYCERLLNASHSLPLTLAYIASHGDIPVRQEKMSDDVPQEASVKSSIGKRKR